MGKKKENKDEYFTLQEIRRDYFRNHKIERLIHNRLTKKELLYDNIMAITIIILSLFIIYFIGIRTKLYRNSAVDEYKIILLILTIISIIIEIGMCIYFYKSFEKVKVKEKQNKNGKLNIKMICYLLKESINNKDSEWPYIVTYISVVYWIILFFILKFNIIESPKFVCWSITLSIIFIMILYLILKVRFKNAEMKYIYGKEKITFLDWLKFWNRSKYKKLKKEKIKENQDKFFEDHPGLDNIEIINHLIMINEKEIINSEKKINKIDKFAMYESVITMFASLMIDKFKNFDSKILIVFFVFPLLLWILKKFCELFVPSSYYVTIRENREFIHVLQERKFRLLQQQLENNHLSSIEIDKEKTIDNKLILG